jgi:hypothetical protein
MQIIPLTVELAPRLARLFPDDPPIEVRLWAILDDLIQGRILVDESTGPAIKANNEIIPER